MAIGSANPDWNAVIPLNHLRNEFDFWNVHGIMNISLTLQQTRSIHDSMNRSKLNLLLIFTLYYKYLLHLGSAVTQW